MSKRLAISGAAWNSSKPSQMHAERAQQELTLQLALGAPLLAVKGHGSPRSGTDLRASPGAVSAGVGDVPARLGPAGIIRLFISCGQSSRPHGNSGSSSSLWPKMSKTQGSPVVAHRMLGTTLFYLGEVSAACERLHQGLALYIPLSSICFMPISMARMCRSIAVSMRPWLCGCWATPEQAPAPSSRARTQALAHPLARRWPWTTVPGSINMPPGGASGPGAGRGGAGAVS